MNLRSLSTLILSLFLSSPVGAQPSLEVMKGQYEAMLEIASEPFEERKQKLFEQYAVAVERLATAFEEKGDSVNAAVAREEAELARTQHRVGDTAIRGIGQVRAKLSEEAAKIQQATAAKRRAIRDQYLERLKELRLSMLASQDEEGMEAVMEEARRVNSGEVSSEDFRRSKGWEARDWPIDRDGSLVFSWKRGMRDEARLLGGLARSNARLMARDEATFDEEGAMLLVDGSFHARRAGRHLTSAMERAGELTLEVVFTSFGGEQRGPARIITFSTDGDRRNFTLGQSQDRLILRLRTPETGLNGGPPETQLCQIQVDSVHHVLITYRSGELVTYLDGEEVLRSDAVEGDFSNWDGEQELVFGDEYLDKRNWNGTIDGVAISNQFTEFEAALKSYLAASGLD